MVTPLSSNRISGYILLSPSFLLVTTTSCTSCTLATTSSFFYSLYTLPCVYSLTLGLGPKSRLASSSKSLSCTQPWSVKPKRWRRSEWPSGKIVWYQQFHQIIIDIIRSDENWSNTIHLWDSCCNLTIKFYKK
jgi:hypothetical protein